ncbi:hypothetical protein ES702_00836 [subsurface metagenome]
MICNSAYVVQTQVISMSNRPFHAGKELRPIFRPIFNSSNCFDDMRDSKLYDWRHKDELPSKPFIRNLGQICFNVIREEFSEYDPRLEDQRMNHLHFELRKPLFLKATFDGQTQADGKAFIHFYPSGYIVIHLAIALKQQQNLQSLNSLHQAIRETRPMRSDSRWIWSSRLGTGKLPKIVELIRENIYQSLYTNFSTSNKHNHWHSALKLITTYDAKRVANRFFKGKYDLFNLWPHGHSDYSDEYLLSSKQGVACGLSPYRSRHSALRFFWRISDLYEFVILKSHIYDDYAEFLRSEIANLKDFRLSTLRKLTREDMSQFSVYDPQIPQYFAALDRHIRSAKPFYRRIYSSISSGTGFDEHREKVKKLVNEWEAEVKQWEHGLSVLWKKVISPLRSILRLG